MLLLAGRLPAALEEAASAAHDVMSYPRCTMRWTPDSPQGKGERAGGRRPQGVVEAILGAHRDLLAGSRPSQPPVLRDEDPAPWRGVGPYGQGGSGMTGGVPYGRPMAERAAETLASLAETARKED